MRRFRNKKQLVTYVPEDIYHKFMADKQEKESESGHLADILGWVYGDEDLQKACEN